VSRPEAERARILVLVKGLGIGGAETLIAESASLWATSDFDYRVAYLLPWKDQLVGRLRDSGIDVTCLDWRGPQSLRAIRRLRELVDTWRPHLVHSHLPLTGILARTAVGARRRQVYTEHNVVDFYRQPTRALNRLTYGRNDAVIAVSDAVAESLEGYPGPLPRVIPNGVPGGTPDPALTASVRRELAIAPDAPLFVHVGNIRPHKGHETLTRAVAIVTRRRPEVVVVSIGGEKVPGDLDRVRQRAADLGVDEQLRFLGRRSDAQQFLAAADVVVNPSDVEGLPLSILEALAMARPVVATDVGGVSSVIRHEATGLLVPAGDPDALAAAMVEALDSPQAPDWGRAGAEVVAAGHGLQGMVEAYEQLYRDVLDE